MDEDTQLLKELDNLKKEHKELEEKLKDEIMMHECDPMEVARNKKRKLAIKDRINEIYNILYPDEPA